MLFSLLVGSAFAQQQSKSSEPSPLAQVGGNFGGEWQTTNVGYSVAMSLRQDGNRVTGTYTWAGGSGKLEGTATGKMLLYSWNQIQVDGRTGTGHFILSDDGRSFDRYWSQTNDPYNKSGGHWVGQRK